MLDALKSVVHSCEDAFMVHLKGSNQIWEKHVIVISKLHLTAKCLHPNPIQAVGKNL